MAYLDNYASSVSFRRPSACLFALMLWLEAGDILLEFALEDSAVLRAGDWMPRSKQDPELSCLNQGTDKQTHARSRRLEINPNLSGVFAATAGGNQRSTKMSSSCRMTANVSTGSMAGKQSASPVLSEKQAPCKGQMTVSPSISPSDKRAHSCVQISLIAKYLPSTLYTAMGGSSSHFTPPEASSDLLQTRRKAMAK
jgi:hypothetical protein